MNRTLILIAFLCIGHLLFAQAPNWNWANGIGSNSWERSHTIEMDDNGDLYIAGTFASSSLAFGNTTLANQGNYDVFLAKYNALGTKLWAVSLGGSAMDEAWDVITDFQNNVYVTGYYKSTNFYIGIDTILHNSGLGSLFLVKYDMDGNFIWAINSTGYGRDWGRALGVDESNNVYLGGNFVDGDITIIDTTLINQGESDFFVAKFNSSGDRLWTRHTGGSDLDLLRNLVVSPEFRNVYFIGDFGSSTVTFDSITFTNASSLRDNFVVKYDEFGNTVWAKHITGTGEEQGSFIAVDWKENIYVTGQYGSGVCYFDWAQLTNSTTSQETYLTMYDQYGDVMWVTGMYGEYDDIAYSITSDMDDGVYICGYFNSSNFGIGTDIFSSNGGFDIFVSKFDYFGNYYWTKQCGGTSDDHAECVVSDLNGNLYVTGKYRSSNINFDAITLNNNAGEDIFISKLSNNYSFYVTVNSTICEGDSIYLENDFQTLSGSYYDSLTSAGGWDSVVNTLLTVVPMPNPIITQNINTLTSSYGISYQWYYDGNIISGATNQSYQPINDGNYQVEIVNNEGCIGISDNYYFQYIGIPEIDNEFTLYPNPAANYIYVNNATDIKIYSYSGTLLITSKTKITDVTTLKSGV